VNFKVHSQIRQVDGTNLSKVEFLGAKRNNWPKYGLKDEKLYLIENSKFGKMRVI